MLISGERQAELDHSGSVQKDVGGLRRVGRPVRDDQLSERSDSGTSKTLSLQNLWAFFYNVC